MSTKSKSEYQEPEEKITKQPPQHKASSTKNRKGLKKDVGQTNRKKQKKITTYVNANSITATIESTPDPQQVRINQLREEILAKDEQINQIRTQKEIFEHKYSVSYMQNKSFKQKSRQILIKMFSQQAERKRSQRRKIDNKLGYFTDNMKQFVYGEDWIFLQNLLQQKNQRLQKFKSQLRKSKSNDQMNGIKFAITFTKKQISNIEQEMSAKEKEIVTYKERQKLAIKESKCTYAKQNWALIKDSRGKQRYLPLYLIGQGGFGQVYKCFDLDQNQYVAIKINNVKLGTPGEQNNTFKHVQREVKTHVNLKHPNIAEIKEILQLDFSKIVFVLEYCDGPQLSIYLKQRKCIQEKDAKKIIYQVFSALFYLSELGQKVIHYDLKPSNIIFHRGVVKILDFGLCKLMENEQSRMELTSQGVGTYWYLPPEAFALEHATITDRVDIWSAGVIFFQMLYGKKPFAHGVSPMNILKGNLIAKQTEKQLVFPDSTPNGYRVSKDAQSFIEQCLRRNPDKRLSAAQAYNHKYFKS